MSLPLSAFWERGYPNLPACGLRRGSRGGPVRPIFINSSSRPSRAASPGRLARRRRDQGKGTSRRARDPSRDDRDQAGAGPRSVLVSPLVQREQAQAKASGKGYRFGATRPRPAEWQDGGHRGAQDGVIVRVFGSRRPTLGRISVLDVPLQNGQLLAPFLLNIWEEAQGHCL